MREVCDTRRICPGRGMAGAPESRHYSTSRFRRSWKITSASNHKYRSWQSPLHRAPAACALEPTHSLDTTYVRRRVRRDRYVRFAYSIPGPGRFGYLVNVASAGSSPSRTRGYEYQMLWWPECPSPPCARYLQDAPHPVFEQAIHSLPA